MIKAEKVVQLLTLLSHRRVLSLFEISEVCGVSTRTAFRYLDTISESGWPVEYDRDHRGYRLAFESSFSVSGLSLQEAVLCSYSLGLAFKLTSRYRSEIDQLRLRLTRSSDVPLEVVNQIMHVSDSDNDSIQPDLSTELTIVIIFFALEYKRALRVQTAHAPDPVSLNEPRLVFEGSWRLKGKAKTGTIEIPMEDIVAVAII